MGYRRKIKGSFATRLRLCVYRSAKHIYAQIIDDEKGITVCSASSLKLQGDTSNETDLTRKVYLASKVGKEIAQEAKKRGITKVFFDRNGYKYHGRVKQLAESARREGLDF